MPTHKLELSFDGPFEDDAAVCVVEFLEANGYTRQDDTLRFARGEEGAGWWSSAMCDLKTALTVELSAEAAKVIYEIDIEGQRLSEEDRKFWPGEAEHLCGYLRGGPLFDLRHAEQKRASRTRGASIRLAMTAGFAIFCLIIVLHFLDFI
jgi:hypothetical protein